LIPLKAPTSSPVSNAFMARGFPGAAKPGKATAMTLVQDAPVRDRLVPARAAWRNLLVHVQPEAGAQPRLEAAADLARKLDAQLLGLGAEMIAPIAMSDPSGMLGGEWITLLQQSVETNLENARTAFVSQTKGMKADWLAVEDLPARAVVRVSRAADLVISGGSPLNARDTYRWCDPAELALQCGRPVLVAPPGGGKLRAQSVVVAWKDTREARRALADSLPILKCADEVIVLAVCPKDEARDAEVHTTSVLNYLLRHGVEGRAKIVVGDDRIAARELQACADKADADLIVCGAYGHTRLGEWIFGGVTIELLEDPRRFLLLSH
jgi:nucleotide-binding universal stress UspA family protein